MATTKKTKRSLEKALQERPIDEQTPISENPAAQAAGLRARTEARVRKYREDAVLRESKKEEAEEKESAGNEPLREPPKLERKPTLPVDDEDSVQYEPRQQRLPIWQRRTEALRERGVTSRDLFGGNPWYIDAPAATKKNCHFLWMSDIMWQKRPMLPGFRWDIYQPVTKELEQELGIKLATKNRTSDGVGRVGEDAFLVWAPKELVLEQDEIFLEGSRIAERMKAEHARFREGVSGPVATGDATGPTGEVVVTNDAAELAEAQARQ